MHKPIQDSWRIPRYSRDPIERSRQIEAEPLPSSTAALLDEAAAEKPGHLAWRFIDSGETATYREVQAMVNRIASGLHRLGVRKGTHVAVMVPNLPQFPVTWLALGRLGAVMVPVNISYTGRELDYIVNDGDAEYLVLHEEYLPTLRAMLKRPAALDDGRVVVVGGPQPGMQSWQALHDAGDPAFKAPGQVGLDDLLNIQYTSGTTGFPKGVMQAHRYWITQSRLNAFRDGLVYERIMISTPFYYMDPQWLLLMAFHQRASCYIAARQSTTRYVEWLHKYRTQFSLMPGEVMFKHPPTPFDTDNDVRRVNVYGLRREVHAQVEERFNVNAREAFGMTELGSATFLPLEADDMIGKGSCGITGPFRECKVVDAEGREVPRGEIGEMVVRGPGILLGYYNKPEANTEAFFGDWFRTGDLFRQDERGYFFIVGRLKEMIRRSSENIPAREVEAVLKDLPDIVEAAVIGVPDEIRKEEVKAYVILQPGLTKEHVPPDKIIEHARKYLAPFKVPRYIEYRDEFPRTPSLKVRKPELVKEKPDLRADSWDRVDGVWR
ncbi:MAG: acyl--CoA ligase [Candidatus Parcubacteria bacterium]|nr:acyl--CoA ligase [Burkholderiales bacterium]